MEITDSSRGEERELDLGEFPYNIKHKSYGPLKLYIRYAAKSFNLLLMSFSKVVLNEMRTSLLNSVECDYIMISLFSRMLLFSSNVIGHSRSW